MSNSSDMMVKANDALDEFFGDEVTLERGASSATITANWLETGASVGRSSDDHPGDGIERRVWLIAKAEYDVGPGPIEPQAGDTIEDRHGNVWEVMPDGEIAAADNWMDDNAYWQVRSKKVG